MNPLYVHTKVAKGRTYYYFDTGQKKPNGQPILSRLPDKRDPRFGRALADAQSARKKREKIPEVRNFEWLVRTFEASPEFGQKSSNTKRLYSLHLGYATNMFRNGEGRSWPIDVITDQHVLALRDKLQDRRGTANATLKSLSAMMSWATKPGRKLIPANVASEVELLDMNEHEPWPEKLLHMALEDKAIRLPVAMLYYIGQRIGDTVRIGPGTIEDGVFKIVQEKTGTKVYVPRHEHLLEIIAEDAPDTPDDGTYLTNEWGKPVTKSGIRQRIQKWATGKGYKIVPHGLRKNAVETLLKAGCPVAHVSSITGQSLQMVEHYAKHLNKKPMAVEAMAKFEARTKKDRENSLRKPEDLLS